VWPPPDDIHAEGLADSRHALADPTEADKAEHSAHKGVTELRLPAAVVHSVVGDDEVLGQFKDQGPGGLRGGRESGAMLS
jgi:hypothetical protein